MTTALQRQSDVNVFIYRKEGSGRWEVHIPFEAPTDKMIDSYWGDGDDLSVPEEGNYYVSDSDYPFAFFLSGVTIDSFKNTILLRSNESKRIDNEEMYPGFIEWSVSKGRRNKSWYKR